MRDGHRWRGEALVGLYRGDFDLVAACGEDALTTCAAIPQGFRCTGARWLLARTALARGEDDRAAELYEGLLVAARGG